MGRNKWRSFESGILILPFAFILLYAAHLPLPLPAFLLPDRLYVALPRSAGAAALASARGHAFEAFALLPDRLLPLPPLRTPTEEWERILGLLPDQPVLDTLKADFEKGLPLFRRATLLAGFAPTAEEITELGSVAVAQGLPFDLRLLSPAVEAPLRSFSYRTGEIGSRLSFELFFKEGLASESRLEVASLNEISERPSSSAPVSRLLWSGRGNELPDDLVLRLSADRTGLAAILLGIEGPAGRRTWRLDPGSEPREKPRVLVISEKEGSRSLIENLYFSERVNTATAAKRNLFDFELVVIDGIPIRDIAGTLKRSLLQLAERRAGSILFAADSPAFGTVGDNPDIERLLPVTLLAPSLKDLPDIELLILLDDSGSMFGDKLSLAKVTGLELLKGLKKTDRVGLMLFSDTRRWVWNFERNQDIVAAPILDPVEAEGGTELGRALAEGLDRLSAEPAKQRHIVIISDGVTRPADFPALATRARSQGITISTMGVGPDLNRALLEKLARQANGRFYFVGSADEIPALIFEDRKSTARPTFLQGSIPVFDLGATKIATIGGMAQYAARENTSILFANDLGDPLFSGMETGNRSIMLFASDLYGTYTADLFANPSAIATIRDRLDALFTERPPEISILETSREARVLVRSDSLASPRLLLSRQGESEREIRFIRAGPDSWQASVVAPSEGRWRVSLLDRGSSLASFDLARNEGIGGVDSKSAAAARDLKGLSWRTGDSDQTWLILFFISVLVSSIVLRIKR